MREYVIGDLLPLLRGKSRGKKYRARIKSFPGNELREAVKYWDLREKAWILATIGLTEAGDAYEQALVKASDEFLKAQRPYFDALVEARKHVADDDRDAHDALNETYALGVEPHETIRRATEDAALDTFVVAIIARIELHNGARPG